MTKTNETAQNDIWGIQEFEVKIELAQINPGNPISFFMRIQMNSESKEARQKFSGLKPEEKDAALHDHYVNLISLLSTKAPQNVPGFDSSASDFRAEIREFFSGENLAKQLVISEAIEEYFSLAKRKDFFRSN